MIALPDPFPDDPAGEEIRLLGEALRAAGTACRIRERRLMNQGMEEVEDAMLGLWQICDDLAEAIVDSRCETLADLREKAEAFFWLDGGTSEDEGEEEARVRVVVEVMRVVYRNAFD